MATPDGGVRYRASPKAYVVNYLIAAGVVFLLFLVSRKFNLSFSVSPGSVGEALGTAVYVGFIAAALWLLAEPVWERIMRYYVVTRSEVTKVDGLLRKRRHTIPYQGVSAVSVSKGILGRILNYGTVEIEGMRETGSGIAVRHIGDPDEFHRLVQHRVHAAPQVTVRKSSREPEEEGDEDGE